MVDGSLHPTVLLMAIAVAIGLTARLEQLRKQPVRSKYAHTIDLVLALLVLTTAIILINYGSEAASIAFCVLVILIAFAYMLKYFFAWLNRHIERG